MKIISNGRSLELGSGGGSASEDYSTEEQVIGTWIDGKPLYKRCFLTNIPSQITAGSWNLLCSPVDGGTVVSFSVCTLINSLLMMLPFTEVDGRFSTLIYINQLTSGLQPGLYICMNRVIDSLVGKQVLVTYKYTKYTDAAEVALEYDVMSTTAVTAGI